MFSSINEFAAGIDNKSYGSSKDEASFDERADAGVVDEADAIFEVNKFLSEDHFAAAADENASDKNRVDDKSDMEEEKDEADFSGFLDKTTTAI